MNHRGKQTGGTISRLLTERITIWSAPVGVFVILAAFYAGSWMSGTRKTLSTPTVIKPQSVYGVAEPVYTSLPNMMPTREPESDLVISANPRPKPPHEAGGAATRDNRLVQQPESVDTTAQGNIGESAAAYNANAYRMDSNQPAEPSSAALTRSDAIRVNGQGTEMRGRYLPAPEKSKPDSAPKIAESTKDDPWNGETRRKYDSFFSDADFRDGHRFGGR